MLKIREICSGDVSWESKIRKIRPRCVSSVLKIRGICPGDVSWVLEIREIRSGDVSGAPEIRRIRPGDVSCVSQHIRCDFMDFPCGDEGNKCTWR